MTDEKNDETFAQVDFWGHALPLPRGRGQPEFVVTQEKINKVMMLQAFGKTQKEIAERLGKVSVVTLRKYFSKELKLKKIARDLLATQLDAKLVELALIDGKVPAIRALQQRLQDLDRSEMAQAVRGSDGKNIEKAKRAMPIKKGDRAANDAQSALETDDLLSGRHGKPLMH